jgi:hypothetical protein
VTVSVSECVTAIKVFLSISQYFYNNHRNAVEGSANTLSFAQLYCTHADLKAHTARPTCLAVQINFTPLKDTQVQKHRVATVLQHAKAHQGKNHGCLPSKDAFWSLDFQETLMFQEFTCSFAYLISSKLKTSHLTE